MVAYALFYFGYVMYPPAKTDEWSTMPPMSYTGRVN